MEVQEALAHKYEIKKVFEVYDFKKRKRIF